MKHHIKEPREWAKEKTERNTAMALMGLPRTASPEAIKQAQARSRYEDLLAAREIERAGE